MAVQAIPTQAESIGFERVLVLATDGAAGEAAATTAIEFAEGYDATLHALYVVDVAKHWDMVVEREEEQGESLVESIETTAEERDVTTVKHFRYGGAVEEVLDYVRAHEIDLVIVGSPDRSGIDRLVRPTPIARRLVGCCPAPVLAVGPYDR